MKRGKKNRGMVGWAYAHPILTFLIVGGVIGTVRLAIVAASAPQIPERAQ